MVYVSENRNVFRFRLKLLKEEIWRRERGRLFQATGPETEKKQAPAVESLERGMQRDRVPEEERRVQEGV